MAEENGLEAGHDERTIDIETWPNREELRAIEEIDRDSFVYRRSGRLTRLAEKLELMDPAIIELAEACLLVYRKVHEQARERAREKRGGPGSVGEDYGLFVNLVGKVKISAIDSKGRWLINFKTTHLGNKDDWRITGSVATFDIEPMNLDETYPAREKHWIVGKRGEKIELIGRYKDLYDSSDGQVAARLKEEGWSEIGEVWMTDVDRHLGFLQDDKS